MKGWLKFICSFVLTLVGFKILFSILNVPKWETIIITLLVVGLIVFPYSKLKK